MGFVAAGAAVAVMAPASVAAATCASGALTGGPSSQPELGAYEYHLSFSWGPLRAGLSHVDLLVDHLECIHLCSGESPFLFDEVAGTSTGDDGGKNCDVSYGGALLCAGDPSVGLQVPLVKWGPTPQQPCQPGASGAGDLVFYSNWPPGPVITSTDAIWIKFGTSSCFGPVTGTFPLCGEQPTATEGTTWGGVKSLYR
jgi:hypothetical protein